jgi:5-methylcytosine-specific restriction endonuclease McrA
MMFIIDWHKKCEFKWGLLVLDLPPECHRQGADVIATICATTVWRTERNDDLMCEARHTYNLRSKLNWRTLRWTSYKAYVVSTEIRFYVSCNAPKVRALIVVGTVAIKGYIGQLTVQSVPVLTYLFVCPACTYCSRQIDLAFVLVDHIFYGVLPYIF